MRSEFKGSNDGFTVVVETVENNFLDCAPVTVTDSKLSSELNWIQVVLPV